MAGAVAGLVAPSILLVLSRATRIGDLVRFGMREHVTRRELDRLESKYQTWRRAEIGRRFLALDTAAREGLLL